VTFRTFFLRASFLAARRAIVAGILTLGVVAALLAVTTATFAQSAASVSGIVTDSSGKAIGNARVQLTGLATLRATSSDAAGHFSFSVPSGTYSVTASANGFESARNDDVVVTAEQPANLAFSLPSATLQQIGQVVSNQNALSPNTTTASTQNLSAQTIVDQGQTQVKRVLDQIPGVEINQFSSNAPGANTSISIRGAQPYESQILIDGHPVVGAATGVYGFNSTFMSSLLLGEVEVSEGPGNLPNTIENAVGGTLNFRTPTITGGPTLNAIAGVDSWDSNYFGLRFSDTFGKLGFLIGATQYWTPGYLAKGTMINGGDGGSSVYPTVTAGTAYNPRSGVINFSYPGSQNFSSASQLVKIAYNFSPVTSVQFSQFSTQTDNDETGTNLQYGYATIVPCIIPGKAATCTGTGTPDYTSSPFLGLIGSVQPINLYAPYANDSEFDNEPMYSGEFRTLLGPGSLLARYYTGTIARILSQSLSPSYAPCPTVACTTATSNEGSPYIENETDVLHGLDAQYSIPFGPNDVTLGFDRHVDSTYGDWEYDPASIPAPTPPPILNTQSISYSVRTDLQVAPKLKFEGGLYDSSTTWVGDRLDPRGGFVYTVDPDASIRVSAGSAYVAPYYSLITPTTPVPKAGGTLDLATGTFLPETSFGYDAGSDVKVGPDNLFSADVYLTNIFNRYATVTQQTPGTYDGVAYTAISQNGNQALVRNMGVEFSFTHAPHVGLGYRGTVDLLRDYAYNQTSVHVSNSSIFGSGTPGNFVQLPTYPYSKINNNLFYTFQEGAKVNFSAESYGANNSFGQAGFTIFGTQISTPLPHGLSLVLGGINIFNYNDNQQAGIYDGGYTYPELSGGTGYTTLYYAQPRTVYLQLQFSVGHGATPVSALP
jgi:TonB dependent receptor/Carboxypeptidase regulatory-like domain/TonB-dependent Receptor Plug Domain